jgi:hypothetical protein
VVGEVGCWRRGGHASGTSGRMAGRAGDEDRWAGDQRGRRSTRAGEVGGTAREPVRSAAGWHGA